MDDDGTDARDHEAWIGEVERAVLSESPEGRAISAGFIAALGAFMTDMVRPILRDVAGAGGEPQLLVNGLAQMLRDVADSMEFPASASSPVGTVELKSPLDDGAADPDGPDVRSQLGLDTPDVV
jgi:hypothetical protein